MRDGRPNPDIWGNIITCGEIAVGIYEIVGSKKRGLEIPKAVAEEILPESVMEQAVQDGDIPASRHRSYLRLYDELKDLRAWQKK